MVYKRHLKLKRITSFSHFFPSIYTPFSFQQLAKPPLTVDLLGIEDTEIVGSEQIFPELFFFEYGVVVIWGMEEHEEKMLLHQLTNFDEKRQGCWFFLTNDTE